MTIKFPCPNPECTKTWEVSDTDTYDKYVGKTVTCNVCKKPVIAPSKAVANWINEKQIKIGEKNQYGDGETFLHRAFLDSQIERDKEVIEKVIDWHLGNLDKYWSADKLKEYVNSREEGDGDTPLCYAAMCGHVPTIKCLLKWGANIHHKNNNGFTPFLGAVFYDRDKAMECLYKHDKKVLDKNAAIPLAATRGCVKALEQLSKWLKEDDFNIIDASLGINGKVMPIIHATMGGHTKAVKWFLDELKMKDINLPMEEYFSVPPDGYHHPNTLLHYAAIGEDADENDNRKGEGRVQMMQWLKENCTVDTQVINSYGETPMHWAARYGYVDAMEWLLENRPGHVNAQEVINATSFKYCGPPLYYAVETGYADAIKEGRTLKAANWLLGHGALDWFDQRISLVEKVFFLQGNIEENLKRIISESKERRDHLIKNMQNVSSLVGIIGHWEVKKDMVKNEGKLPPPPWKDNISRFLRKDGMYDLINMVEPALLSKEFSSCFDGISWGVFGLKRRLNRVKEMVPSDSRILSLLKRCEECEARITYFLAKGVFK
ncbi:MAG: ankyrin repeat domain-containing protein [Planctomycetaceae bacterium]|nr:ankyrin repeat domain-containing protein [Planctomycetaceae bacterium]